MGKRTSGTDRSRESGPGGSTSLTGTPADPLGRLLREARRATGLSQMEVSLRLGMSQRHLGFVELGRSRPSRPLLLRLLDELAASPSLVNAALHHAGFAPQGPCEGEASDQLMAALARMTDAHDPFPALVFDADWHAQRISRGGWWLCKQIMPGALPPPGDTLDMIATVAAANGLLSCARNPEIAASALLCQMQVEAWARPSLRPRIEACEEALVARYGPLPDSVRAPGSTSLLLTFDTACGDLSFFTLQTVPGIPQDVSLGAIRAELWFPLDEHTRAVLTHEVRRTP